MNTYVILWDIDDYGVARFEGIDGNDVATLDDIKIFDSVQAATQYLLELGTSNVDSKRYPLIMPFYQANLLIDY